MAMSFSLPDRTSSSKAHDAVGEENPSQATRLLLGRLDAWRHACVYLEDYMSAIEKAQHAYRKEYEKALKIVSTPLKESNQFDQSLGGITGMFENIRTNTQGIVHLHEATEKNLKHSALPVLSRVESEIEKKTKELSGDVAKDLKSVDKARNASQTWIDLLGHHTASFETAAIGGPGHKVDPATDPYVIQRQLYYRLNKQIDEENNHVQDLLEIQGAFQQFEAYILKNIQQAMGSFVQTVAAQAEQTKVHYEDMSSTAQRIPPDFEWSRFYQRQSHVLLDPEAPTKSIKHVKFPNQNHPSTQPLIAGELQRKSRLLGKGYSTGYYVVTPSKYLHEFNDDDDFSSEPIPELSLYLPDCTIGSVEGSHFTVKGKNVSKGKLGSALATKHELEFKAHSTEEAERWWKIIREIAIGDSSIPESSPVDTELSTPVVQQEQKGLSEGHHPPAYAEEAPKQQQY